MQSTNHEGRDIRRGRVSDPELPLRSDAVEELLERATALEQRGRVLLDSGTELQHATDEQRANHRDRAA
jgi:hypothetical protein